MRLALGLASLVVLAACNFSADAQDVEPSGRTTSRTFDAAGFDAVSVAGPYDAVVRVGPAASVRAEGDEALVERMKVEVKNGELRVGTERGVRFNWGRARKTVVYITLPAIRAAEIAGSGDMTIDRVEGRSFEGDLAGSGNLAIERLRADQVEFSVAGSGNIRARGEAGRVEVSIAGSGDVDIADLRARDLDVSIAGSGNVRSFASATADVSIMGSGDVEVGGSARCSVNKMGSGSVRCGG